MKRTLAFIFALFFATAAHAQNGGTATNHAFAIGKGPNVQGFTSLLCGSGQIPLGQSAANPLCVAITGDAAISAAGVLTLGNVNPNVGSFGSATQCPTVAVNAKGQVTAASQTACTPAAPNLTGAVTSVGVATSLGSFTSAQLFAALATKTGTGLPVFGTAPSITAPTGIVKGDVGLGNVANLLQLVGVHRQTFCPSGCTTTIASGSTGTYTPTAGTAFAQVEIAGPGAGGGGCTGTVGSIYSGGGGASGGYSRSLLTAATIGASKTVVMGTKGAGGAAGTNNGGAGVAACLTTSTCVSGQIIVANAGSGGIAGSSASAPTGGASAASGTGDVVAAGTAGLFGSNSGGSLAAFNPSGGGGSSFFGGGAQGISNGGALTGANAGNYGSGGSGGNCYNTVSTAAGGNGSDAIVVITEYTNQ